MIANKIGSQVSMPYQRKHIAALKLHHPTLEYYQKNLANKIGSQVSMPYQRKHIAMLKLHHPLSITKNI